MNSLYEDSLRESEKQAKNADNANYQSTDNGTVTPETASNKTDADSSVSAIADVNNENMTGHSIEQECNKSNGDLTVTKHKTVSKAISHPLELPSDEDDLFDEEFTADNPTNNVLLPSNQDVKRRVYFPEDERIVSGYMDPPRPWNDASLCSTDELIQAYIISCDRFGVKPLPRLLQQLQVINDFCDRNETLTLRGERLDYKHCETVEEILRRVQFQTIDLEGTHLEEEGAVALFDMIEYYESCHRLNISNNRTIGIRGWQACARLMKKTPCLENLEMRNCTISEQVMPFICRSLRLGSMITILHLENSLSSGRPLIVLVTALKMNDYLRELYLADNKLMPSDGIQLGNLLKYNFRLQLLDVRNNHLQDVGTSHICDGIWEQNLGHGLSTLVLWNNQITFQSMGTLGRALMNTKSLETLNLGHNNLTNEGVHRLKDGLLANKSLLRIGLQAAKISCEGGVAIAEFIAESPRLLRMDLRENDIKTGGLMALALSLKVSESVTRIDIDKETKRETSMKDYAEQQRRLLNDISNYMQRNRDLARQKEEAEEEKQRILMEQSQIEEQEAAEAALVVPPLTPEVPEDDGLEKSDISKEQASITEADEGAIVPTEDGKVHSPRPDHLDLDPTFGMGSKTLDSPAFTTAGFTPQLAFMMDNEQASSPTDNSNNRQGVGEPLPASFPPSPMVSSNGRPTLAPILGASPSLMSPVSDPPVNTNRNFLGIRGHQEVVRKSPNTSPTMKRKFIISRVQEPKPRLGEPDGQQLLKDMNVPIINLDDAFKKVAKLAEGQSAETDPEADVMVPGNPETGNDSGTVTGALAVGNSDSCAGRVQESSVVSSDTITNDVDVVNGSDKRISLESSLSDNSDTTLGTNGVDSLVSITLDSGTSPRVMDTCQTPAEQCSMDSAASPDGQTDSQRPTIDKAASSHTATAAQEEECQSSPSQALTESEAKSTDYSAINGVRKDMNTLSSQHELLGDLDLGELELNELDRQLQGSIPQTGGDNPTCPEEFEKELDVMLANISEPAVS